MVHRAESYCACSFLLWLLKYLQHPSEESVDSPTSHARKMRLRELRWLPKVPCSDFVLGFIPRVVQASSHAFLNVSGGIILTCQVPTAGSCCSDCCCWVPLTLCNHMDCSTPGFPVLDYLLEFAHVHWVGDAIQPSHPLSSSSPPAFTLSQHQGLFQWVGCSHQGAKVLELQL